MMRTIHGRFLQSLLLASDLSITTAERDSLSVPVNLVPVMLTEHQATGAGAALPVQADPHWT